MRGILHVLGLVACLLDTPVFMLLWRWFVAPLGLPALGFWHAMGLNILIALATRQFSSDLVSNDIDQLGEKVSFHLALPVGTLVFGAIAHWLM